MEFKGKITSAFQGEKETALSVVSLFRLSDLEGLDFNKEYRVTIKEWRDKKTKDQNSYCWEIMSKMAMVLSTSKDDVYDELLQRYAPVDSDHVSAERADRPISTTMEGHWKFLKLSADGKWRQYIKIKGISELDTKEMSYFIDRIVEEAKELGIETMTPAELARLRNE